MKYFVAEEEDSSDEEFNDEDWKDEYDA